MAMRRSVIPSPVGRMALPRAGTSTQTADPAVARYQGKSERSLGS